MIVSQPFWFREKTQQRPVMAWPVMVLLPGLCYLLCQWSFHAVLGVQEASVGCPACRDDCCPQCSSTLLCCWELRLVLVLDISAVQPGAPLLHSAAEDSDPVHYIAEMILKLPLLSPHQGSSHAGCPISHQLPSDPTLPLLQFHH